MDLYDDMREERKEVRRWWVWALGLLIITIIILTVLGYLGLIGQTVVERAVFEKSYQRSEAVQSSIDTFEAQLTELQARRSNPALSAGTKAEIDAQMAAIRIQLDAARRKQ